MRISIGTAAYSRTEIGKRLAGFRSDQTGSLVIFALMLAVLMLMMGGIAVDVMRYESRRTSLQNALDRSTLAAAALNQDEDPEAVVNDYFLKAGLADYLTSVTVTESLTYREVSATASTDTGPMFLHLMGNDEFDADGLSTAEQSIRNVEIMLVLDVSGSMSGDKISKLRLAASEFAATVLTGDDDHHVSIGIVPYVAWQFYARALGTTSGTRTSVYNDTTNAMIDPWNFAPEMDALLQENCAAIRAQNVIIYGIAFQAPTIGQTQIRNCSTDGVAGSHYFNATTMNIASAFQTIASNISQLRLTQ